MHYAVVLRDEDIVNLILQYQTNINQVSSDGSTPLHLAAKMGHGTIVKMLIEQGALSYILDENGKASLHYATEKGHREVVKILLENKMSNVNISDENGKTPLHYAAENGHLEVVEILIKKCQLDALDRKDKTPMHYAADKGHSEVVKILVGKGSRSNVLDTDNKSPLHYALAKVHESVVEILCLERENVRALADVSLLSIINKRLFFLAKECIFATGDYANVPEEDILAIAMQKCKLEMGKQYCCDILKNCIKKRGQRILVDEQTGFSILSLCVKYGHLAAFAKVLERCKVKDFNIGTPTPLWLLASNGEADLVARLLRKFRKIKYSQKAPDSTSALVQAIAKNNVGVIEAFLNSTVISHKSIFCQLAKFGRYEILYKRMNRNHFQHEFDRQNLILCAIMSGEIKTVKFVLEMFPYTPVLKEFVQYKLRNLHSIDTITYLKTQLPNELFRPVHNGSQSSFLVNLSQRFRVFNEECENQRIMSEISLNEDSNLYIGKFIRILGDFCCVREVRKHRLQAQKNQVGINKKVRDMDKVSNFTA